MRGWMTAVTLFLFDLFSDTELKTIREKLIFNKLRPYIPGGIIALFFLVIHYIAKGWVGYHSGSPWAPTFQRVDISGFLYNIGIYIWRLFDFGRVIWYILLLLYANGLDMVSLAIS